MAKSTSEVGLPSDVRQWTSEQIREGIEKGWEKFLLWPSDAPVVGPDPKHLTCQEHDFVWSELLLGKYCIGPAVAGRLSMREDGTMTGGTPPDPWSSDDKVREISVRLCWAWVLFGDPMWFFQNCIARGLTKWYADSTTLECPKMPDPSLRSFESGWKRIQRC